MEERVLPVGGDVAEGVEDESAFGEAGVREGQGGAGDDGFAGGEEVEVEDAGGIPDGADPAGVSFNGVQEGEEVGRGDGAGEADDPVDVIGLVGHGDGGGAIPGGSGLEGQGRMGRELLGSPSAEVEGGASARVGEVGPEGDQQRLCHGTPLFVVRPRA